MSDTNRKPLAAVTGASCGIGLELAKELARRGYDLIVAAEDRGIEDAARDLEQHGAIVKAVQVDLARYDGVKRYYAELKSDGRFLEVVAINAGVGVGGDFARETDLAAELNIIDLNVASTVHLAKLVLKDMVAENRGRILFTSSIIGAAPGPREAVYAASKAFILSFSEALRNELRDTNISITALMPGATETNFFSRAGMEDTKVGRAEKDDPAEVAKQGIEALLNGDNYVVAGSFKNKLFTAASRIAPETMAEMHRKQAEPEPADGHA